MIQHNHGSSCAQQADVSCPVHVGVLVFPGAEPVRQSKGFPTGRVNRRVGVCTGNRVPCIEFMMMDWRGGNAWYNCESSSNGDYKCLDHNK